MSVGVDGVLIHQIRHLHADMLGVPLLQERYLQVLPVVSKARRVSDVLLTWYSGSSFLPQYPVVCCCNRCRHAATFSPAGCTTWKRPTTGVASGSSASVADW